MLREMGFVEGDWSALLWAVGSAIANLQESLHGRLEPIQYGLIAEEVAEVYPELVVNGKDGQPETVRYYKLDAMLLNEVQKLAKLHAADQAESAKLPSEIAQQRQEAQAQQAAIKDLREQMQALQITLAQGRSADGNESVGVALAPEATKP